ncbi:hypothetical protein F383_32924 [Gossypium arboreum]|uniref:Uncharacterized protein n=1 Tax=Gossypium arboreum TaxID=29729 RepID=A0A0B0PKK8_GOSAR|nr:hypothetical protein F383_32924 [Gossypium arboreum]
MTHTKSKKYFQIDRIGLLSTHHCCNIETDDDGDATEGLVEGDAPGGPVGVFGGKWVGNLGIKI